ncbi:hypothetical protein D9Q98_004948 [Chlorella vulgaris]|uniref:Protein kinase domain-containing protein n=1 Tax=Chlorella vulgaris TaxID=3077 RepID=A0A9D4TNI0_CHLVU|nr:hypothetical protein D9Q98_004948 [Chlorella vulgaris]
MRGLIVYILLLACASAADDDRQVLLDFKAGITNWDVVAAARGLAGWSPCTPDDCMPVCSWDGIRCDPYAPIGNQITTLDLACERQACGALLEGTLSPNLGTLPYLQTLDLGSNNLSGVLPPQWGLPGRFADLQILRLNGNRFSGRVPAEWGTGPAFEQLVEFEVSDNQLTGPFPVVAYSATFMMNVQLFNIANNRMTGLLPDQWNGLTLISLVSIAQNRFSGTLPPSWGSQGLSFEGQHNETQAIQFLYTHGNRLTGGVPAQWAANGSFTNLKELTVSGNPLGGELPVEWGLGPQAFPSLQSLNMSNANLSGTLPAEWGTDGGLANLRTLALAGNDLSGTIPASWAEQLPLLERVTVQPGNDDLCAWAPAGAAFQACWQGDVMCWSSSLDSDPVNATACGGTGTEQRNSSNFPVTAVAVSVTAAALALVAGLLLLRRRRQRRRQQQLQEDWQKQGSVLPPTQPSDDSQLAQQPSAPIDKPPSGGLAAEPSFAQQLRPSSREQSQHTLAAAASAEAATAAALAATAAGAVAAVAASSGMQSTPDTFRFSFRTSKSMDARALEGHERAESIPEVSSIRMSAPQLRGQYQYQQAQAAQEPQLVASSEPPLSAMQQYEQQLAHFYSAPLMPPAPLSSAQQQQYQHAPQQQQYQYQRQFSGASTGSGPTVGRQSSLQHDSGGNATSGGSGGPAHIAGSGYQASFTPGELDLLMLDWHIPSEAIQILKRPDGSDWRIGSGGFGTVFKAMRNGVQPVAVKVIQAGAGEMQATMSDDEFAREVSILRSCRDTNILQFQGVCFHEQQGTLLVTEFMEGGNLAQNLRAKTVSWNRRGKKIAIDVARALVYLHSRRILHLDIKSANVLLTRDGHTAKLGDVGMAQIMAGDSVSGSVGTLGWSAPELLLGEPCDTKADVYSFGVLLWEIVTGEVPSRGQLRDPVVPDECPPEVAALIDRCLSHDPGDRPTSTNLVELLQRCPSAPPPAAAAPMHRSSSLATAHSGSTGQLSAVAIGASPRTDSVESGTSPSLPPPPPPLERPTGLAAAQYTRSGSGNMGLPPLPERRVSPRGQAWQQAAARGSLDESDDMRGPFAAHAVQCLPSAAEEATEATP